jgi:hypothetical protein
MSTSASIDLYLLRRALADLLGLPRDAAHGEIVAAVEKLVRERAPVSPVHQSTSSEP